MAEKKQPVKLSEDELNEVRGGFIINNNNQANRSFFRFFSSFFSDFGSKKDNNKQLGVQKADINDSTIGSNDEHFI